MSTFSAPTPARTPVQKAARTANVWGWSYILTVLGVFGAWSVPSGPLRFLLLNLGILCTAIGVVELILRHKLLQTGEAKWAGRLAWNQVAGTLSLLWSIYLIYIVPDQLFVDYSKKSDLWNSVMPLIRTLDVTHQVNDAYILHRWHITKIIFVYGVGSALLLSQLWVIWHYLSIAKEIARLPQRGAGAPPVLK